MPINGDQDRLVPIICFHIIPSHSPDHTSILVKCPFYPSCTLILARSSLSQRKEHNVSRKYTHTNTSQACFSTQRILRLHLVLLLSQITERKSRPPQLKCVKPAERSDKGAETASRCGVPPKHCPAVENHDKKKCKEKEHGKQAASPSFVVINITVLAESSRALVEVFEARFLFCENLTAPLPTPTQTERMSPKQPMGHTANQSVHCYYSIDTDTGAIYIR